MKQRKVYDREFKENAVKLSYERDNFSQFARELGISVKQLYSWRSQYKLKGSESFPGNGNRRK
ncbi:MAG: transposase [Bacteroides sp.]